GSDQEESIAQQEEWAQRAAAKENVVIAARFTDEGIRGYDTRKRAGFREMLEFCQQAKRKDEPVDCILCYHVNRFSRADSQETDWYVWEYRKIGVARLLTAQRWFRFEKMEDRLLFGIGQEVNAHKYSLDLAEASTRGKIRTARRGDYTGGPV